MKCHLCGALNADYFASRIESRDDFSANRGREYTIVRCSNCDLYFVDPQPSDKELMDFYKIYDKGEQWEKGETAFNREIIKIIKRFKSSGNVLDIGCGNGELLEFFKKAGYFVHGIEMSESGYKEATEHRKLDVYYGWLETYLAENTEKKFDVVLLMNVLEHLRNPGETLTMINHCLSEKGILAVVVPDVFLHIAIGAIREFFRISDPYMLNKKETILVGIDPPQHLTSFRPNTLVAMVKERGFEPIYIGHAPHVRNAGGNHNIRNYVKPLFVGVCKLIHFLSFRKILIGYSILLIAKKRYK